MSFLREAPSFFRTTGAGKWLRAFGDPSHQASFFLKAPGIRRLSVPVLTGDGLHISITPTGK